jgi:hypothetical protein
MHQLVMEPFFYMHSCIIWQICSAQGRILEKSGETRFSVVSPLLMYTALCCSLFYKGAKVASAIDSESASLKKF